MATKTLLLLIVAYFLQNSDAVLEFRNTEAFTATAAALPENTTIGSALGTIECVDTDDIANRAGIGITVSRLSTELETKPTNRYIAIVTLKKDQDYEVKGNQNERDYQITCTKGNEFVNLAGNLVIVDINDNPPIFERQGGDDDTYQANVNETMVIPDDNGLLIYDQINVTDRDGLDNNFIVPLCVNLTTDPISNKTCDEFFRLEANVTKNDPPSTHYTILLYILQGDLSGIQSFTLSILAMNVPKNPGEVTLNSTSQNVLVQVTDLQNQPPFINENSLRIEIEENAFIGLPIDFNHYIEAYDQDVRDPNPVDFEIIVNDDPQDGSNFFELGPVIPPSSAAERYYTVQLYVTENVDREEILDPNKILRVTIKAFELPKDGLPDRNPMNATANVSIEVIDVNDELPRLRSDTYTMNLDERDPVDRVQIVPEEGSIVVQDRDGPEYNAYSLSILPSQYSSAFSLDLNGGSGTTNFILYVNDSILDYELGVDTITVTLQATDLKDSSLTSTAQVILNLNDVNDFSPVFLQDSYDFEIEETRPQDIAVRQFIGKVSATDGDRSSLYGTVRNYTIDDPSQSFTIDEEGNIYRILPVDFEIQEIFTFSVSAIDSDPMNPKSSTVPVTVRILNLLDTPPIIIGEYVSNVFETTTDLQPQITVKAENVETATTLEFSLVGTIPDLINVNEYFFINPTSGEFTMLQPLNFRFTNAGLIRVLVRVRANTLFSEKYINITVQNQNNDPPVFRPITVGNRYPVTISELAPVGFTVIKLNTTDGDEPNTPASEVFYTIQSGGAGVFELDRADTSKIVISTENTLNPAVIYQIVVVARDNGIPNLSASATVVVSVEDKNNQVPVFEELLYLFTVNANATSGTEIGTIRAFDADQDPRLEYKLNFQTATFEKSNRPVNAFIDLESTIFLQNTASTGIIRVSGNFTQSIYDKILINATVEDLNFEPNTPRQIATASVVITIQADADPTILFDPPWTRARPFIDVSYAENDRFTNTSIFKLQALDPLSATRITIFRKIVSSDPGDYFQVVGSNILLKKPLDFEALEYTNNNIKVVSLIVEAVSDDLSRVNRATINFQVTDVNDNAPVFTEPEYEALVVENALYPAMVTSISATDKDSTSFGLVKFSLEGDTAGNFFIQPNGRNNAVVRVNESANLDFETNSVYNILVVATDTNGAADGQRAIARLTIRVLDENDNAPRFRRPVYRFSAIGTVDLNTTLGRILADDPDTGSGGLIEYSLLPAPGFQGELPFRVRPETESTATAGNILQIGEIYVFRSLENLPDGYVFTLTAQARDKGQPTLVNTTIVEITVSRGVQDPKPKWDPNLNTSVTIPEEQPAGYFVYRVRAQPANILNSSATILYSFITAANASGDFEKFSIDRDTGDITTNQVLDFEEDKLYSLLILATDSTNSTLTNQFLLIVRLLDLDDNDPTFQRCRDKTYNIPVYAYVMEARPAGQFVYRAEACDDDEAPNNDVAYRSYVPQPGSEYVELCPNQAFLFDQVFQLNTLSGVIQTRISLDREDVDTYLLCVQTIKRSSLRKKRGVSDRDLARSLHDVLFVRVLVEDANDNGPVFIDPLVRKVILSYPPIDISVAEATDLDLAPNNGIRYSIQSIEFFKGQKKYRAPAAFTIDANDGKLFAAQSSYEDYVGGYFNIRIKAEDFNGEDTPPDIQAQKIYVTKASNRIRVVINRPADEVVAQDVSNMIAELNELQDGVFYEVDKISYHVVDSQENLLSEKTDVCILVVRDDNVLTVRDATLFVEQQSSVSDILTQYGAEEPGTCDPAKSVYPQGWNSYWWVLVAFAIFIFLCVLILIFIILSLYSGYKRYMDTRRTYLVSSN